MNKSKIIWAIVALIVGLGVGYGVFHSSTKLGGISSMLAENYMPYLYSNGGYYSALPIQTTSTVTAVGVTSTGDTSISGATTLSGSTTASGGFKIGQTGKQFTGVWSGECYLFVAGTPEAPTLVASSTTVVDCQATNPLSSATPSQAALTGGQAVPVWAAGDFVTANPVASSTVVFGGLVIESATGSSTAGYITLRVGNYTGGDLALATSTGIKAQFFYAR